MVLRGCGGAGLAVLHQLAARAPSRGGQLRVAVVDPVDRLSEPAHDRTWCFWLPAQQVRSGWVGEVAAAQWSTLEVVAPDGRVVRLTTDPLTYVMVTSDAYARLVAREVTAAELDVTWFRDPDAAVTGRWTFDSRPAPGVEAPALWQNFVGEFREWSTDVLTPGRATLMDFRVPQADGQTSFGYVMPLNARCALVEYTRFTPARLDLDRYQYELAKYLDLLDLGPSVVTHTESGAIPMAARPFRPRSRPGHYLIGTTGGATRASTGYTFAGMQRQAAGIARDVWSGREPVPGRPHPRRHAWLDAVMLEALHRDLTGADFFSTYFARNPGSRALGFLDGTSAWWEDAAVIAVTPPGPMLRAAGRVTRTALSRSVVG